MPTGARSLAIGLPVTFDQRVRGEVPVVPGMAVLVGTMVGSDVDTIQLL